MADYQTHFDDTRPASKEILVRILGLYPDAKVMDLSFQGIPYGHVIAQGLEGKVLRVDEASYNPANILEAFLKSKTEKSSLICSIEPTSAMGFVGNIHVYVPDERVKKACEEIASQIDEHMRVKMYHPHLVYAI